MALWIEDDEGTLIHTLYVSNFTAKGDQYREDALSNWVSVSDVSPMSDGEVAVFAGASLSSGKREFPWDGSDREGKKVSSGIYTLKIEGTLYWSSYVLCSARIDTTKASGEVAVSSYYSEETATNRNLIADVKVSYR